MYFLYRHIRPDKNEVFYVGIGKSQNPSCPSTINRCRRAYSTNRNQFWHRIVNKNKGQYDVEILFESDSESFIKQKEVEFIALYGRKDTNSGTLANLTDGGELNAGWVVSEQTKKKLSEAQKGRVLSEQTKKKMSKARKGRFIKKGLKNSFFGKKHTPETKKKMSEAQKARYKKRLKNSEIQRTVSLEKEELIYNIYISNSISRVKLAHVFNVTEGVVGGCIKRQRKLKK